ncbi:Ice-structuring protein 4 (fragment) [uncultured Microbacterium sp.]|uniref:Ice-structuring protein 4 n=1 Tax=uncultured Microbacterium sp. TaxID=191216 RepID=A0A1Y5NWG2_9MICO
MIFGADDRAAAQAITAADPAVAAGVFAATLHPFAVAVSSPTSE